MKKIKSFLTKMSYEFLGLLIFAVFAVAILFVNHTAGFIALAGVSIYTLILLIASRNGKNHFTREFDAIGMSQMVSELTEKIDSPVMVVNNTNKIIWHNEEFASLSEYLGKSFSLDASKAFNGRVSYKNLVTAYEEYTDFISISVDDVYYDVKVFPLDFRNQKLYGTVWYNKDKETQLKKTLNDSIVRVAYMVIDNTNEVTQEVQENQRFGTATINKLITDWAAEFKAILTEYDRDKYVMQFENRYYKDMAASKFDILDKVVECSSKESPIPITISIGVSSTEGTLQEKKESAQAALRSALQRGGSLAVVKTENGEDSYGGKTKAVHRQTKIRSRLCRDLLAYHLPKCSNVIIMGHARPDYDSIASNIGIAKLVQTYGKDYCIVADKNDSSISKVFEIISQFPEYDNVFVDAAYAQDQLTPDTLVIITDASNPEIFAARGVYDNASKVIVIDHHAIKETLGSQVIQPTNIDPTASSASELICEILELSVNPNIIRPEEAQILLAGILLDTQFFSRDTGTRTYSACMFLRNAGAEPGKAKDLFKSDLTQFKTVSKIESQMEVHRDKFAIATYSDDTNPENKVTASKAAERMIDIDGINASFVLYSLDNGINLSARSDGSVNVINIAKLLGGGGHFQSAGALIRRRDGDAFGATVFDINEALDILKNAIDEYMGDNTKEGK